MKKRAKPDKPAILFVTRDQYDRLFVLARRWHVGPSEALRRVLDQAFVGRGALIALEAGFTFLEHLGRKSQEEKNP